MLFITNSAPCDELMKEAAGIGIFIHQHAFKDAISANGFSSGIAELIFRAVR
jgi:hypothetical protein